MSKKITILDTTLRDGSYVNRFQFSAFDTELLCEKLDETGVKFIEIGHGLGLGAYRKGGEYAAAATDEEYLKAASKAVGNSSFGMFCIPGIAELEDLDIAHNYGMDFIRVGTNVTEVEKSAPFIEKAKKFGMMVCANYMKSYVLSPAEIIKKAELSKEYGADLIYIVDSAGGMLPGELREYVLAIKENVDIKLGYHGHNNLGLAVSNSLLAAELGMSFIDTSLQGFGRSGGNAPTEQMILVFSRAGYDHGIDIFKTLDAGFDIIQPLILQAGLNPIDMISGYALFHSSYMPLIREYSSKYCIDPKELIIELCKVNQIDAPVELLEKIAKSLHPKDKKLFLSKYHLERYFINEQK